VTKTDLNEVVTLAIPVYGQWQYLDRCLASAQDMGFSAVLVEDGCPDKETLAYLSALHNNTDTHRVFFNQKNMGFAKTVNRAVSKVNTPYVAIINSDVELPTAKCVTDCVERMRKDDTIGTMGIRLLHDDNTIQHGGVVMDWHDRGGNPKHRYRGKQMNYQRACRYEEVPFVTGAFMVMETDFFKEMGGMPTHYGRGYYEDMELCVNVKEAGKRVMYNGTVWAYHFGHKSFNAANFNYSNSEQNMRRWQQRNMKKVVKFYPRNKLNSFAANE